MRANESTSAPTREAATVLTGGVAVVAPAERTSRVLPYALGALGVVCFSLTFPATQAAEVSFSAIEVGVGRSAIAALAAIAILRARHQPLLAPRAIRRQLIIVAATVGVGFGLLSAIALRQVGSVHVAVIAGLIPAATAGMAALRAGERPSRGYWAALGLGLAAVVGFALIQGGGGVRLADLFLLIAIAFGGIGYAEGGVLARQYGGWRVICWAVVLSFPVSLPITTIAFIVSPPGQVTASALAGLGYVGLVSVLLGFFAWYQGMALGGVASIGKLQLAQPALTLGWSALLLSDHVSWLSLIAAAVVIGATAVGRNAKVGTARPARPAEVGPAEPAVTVK